MAETSEGITAECWRKLLEKYPGIEESTHGGQFFTLPAQNIKEFREPRLMTKHDTIESIPAPLKEKKLSVLPISRSAYAVGHFCLYESFPDVSTLRPQRAELSGFETLNLEQLTSESNAINALVLSGILGDFLGNPDTVETFNGRMGSGDFEFMVNCQDETQAKIQVMGSQIEIDGGFENKDSVVIMEAKNVRHSNFLVRQLYYPFRKYEQMVKKPIRLIFSQYTNLTYYLFEYKFKETYDYSSISLVDSAAYSFEDAQISSTELWECFCATMIEYDDNQEENGNRVPFIQADRFDQVVAILERLNGEPEGLRTEEIAEFMGKTLRQASYYPAAGEYLGLFEREKGRVQLSSLAKQILKMPYRERQLTYAKQMLKHEIFHRLFKASFLSESLPSREEVMRLMQELNVCNMTEKGSTVTRRASTVISWLRWLLALPDDKRML